MTQNSPQTSRWQVVLLLFFLTSAVESLSMSHVFAFMPVYLQSMHVGDVKTWVGVLSAITFVIGLPLVPLWGVWAQRYGGKAIVIRSAYVEMAVLIILGLSHSLVGVFIAMLLVGFQLGNTGIMLAAIRQAAPDHRVGFAVSVFSVSSSLGMAGGPLLGGFFTGQHIFTLHGLYEFDGLLSFATGTMLLLFYRQPAIFSLSSSTTSRQSAWTSAWQSIRFTFSLPVTWALFGIYTALMMARQMINPYLPIVIERLPLHGLTPTVAIGDLMGLSAVIGAVITIVAGRIGDKIGFIRILLLAFACLVPAFLLLGLSVNIGWFMLGLTIFSAGYSIGGAMVFALFSTRIPESHRSTALNLVYLPLYVGGIVGPALAALLIKLGGLFGPFVAAGILSAISIMVILTTRKHVEEPAHIVKH